MQNHLKNQTSPYLLQHADNPVNWYPWCEEAFVHAKKEDKPVFLSIGYSTCHWCHVMAHESFEDDEVAEILNRHFISIKVDKEERPDIDSIYMSVCQAYTGSGGWPTSIFLTPEQKPFFAGTYFPKTAKYGQIGFMDLLKIIVKKWQDDRRGLLESADEIVAVLKAREVASSTSNGTVAKGVLDDAGLEQLAEGLIEHAVELYKESFDVTYGGFGEAPKFPTPHNLLFLLRQYEKYGDEVALGMVEKTLMQMYRGGIFDHIGGGFSRYSTDRYFLAPHFEKMLYDNALLIMAYCKAYQLTKKWIYCEVAEKTAEYVLREMTAPQGGFYSAQDADSEGVEGKYYLFDPEELVKLLGEQAGMEFNQYFDITEKGNFEGKNIPNLLHKDGIHKDMTREELDEHRKIVYEYRKNRYKLHLDDKILTSWNALMIAAMCQLYRVTEHENYLEAAMKAQEFIEQKLCEDDVLHVSYREGKCSGKGFLDDYAYEIFALLVLYEATLNKAYLERAKCFCEKAVKDFFDKEQGGFFLYGDDNEQLILRPKETYDGAIFSGNSAMAYNLVRLYWLTGEIGYSELAESQLAFISKSAKQYPAGYSMFLIALSDYYDAPEKITIVMKDREDLEGVPCKVSLDAVISVLEEPTEEYPLKNDKTTYYICKGRSCQPAVNEL